MIINISISYVFGGVLAMKIRKDFIFLTLKAVVLSVFLKFTFQHLRVRYGMRFFMQAWNAQVDCPNGFSLIWPPDSIELDAIWCVVFGSTISSKCFFDLMIGYF